MNWLQSNMKWVMLVTGVMTLSMVYAFIAPQAALQATFGETLQGPLADVVVRSWGSLVAMIGAMLIYGAYHVPSRPLVLVFAGLSKLVYIGLVLSHGSRYLGQQAAISVVVDGIMIVLFAAYLVGSRRAAAI